MSNNQAEFLIKLRDGAQIVADAANEYLLSLAPPGISQEKTPTTTQETTFNILKFDPQKGAQLGDYEVAYKTNNNEATWTIAFNVLKHQNATIKDRFHQEGYQHSYWLFGEGKIYRQKMKPKQ